MTAADTASAVENAGTIKAFWHHGALPIRTWLCLKSFVDHGHRLVLYSYDELRVPAGVSLLDARTVLPESDVFLYGVGPGRGSVAAFSNLFRYRLLWEYGGWWVDTDVLCLKPVIPENDVAFGWESEAALGTAVLKLPRHHRLAERLYDRSNEILRTRKDKLEWGEIGPRLFKQVVLEAGLLGQALPKSIFYPIHWDEYELLERPTDLACVEARVKESTFVHLWNEMRRRSSLDPFALPPQGSYLSKMCIKHAVC